ncbi:hypothetical protein Tco_1197488 [Tanacetum coccineum]
MEKPRAEQPIDENEIRNTSQGRMRSYVTYVMTLLQCPTTISWIPWLGAPGQKSMADFVQMGKPQNKPYKALAHLSLRNMMNGILTLQKFTKKHNVSTNYNWPVMESPQVVSVESVSEPPVKFENVSNQTAAIVTRNTGNHVQVQGYEFCKASGMAPRARASLFFCMDLINTVVGIMNLQSNGMYMGIKFTECNGLGRNITVKLDHNQKVNGMHTSTIRMVPQKGVHDCLEASADL